MVLVIALLDDKDRRNARRSSRSRRLEYISSVDMCRSFVGIPRYSNCENRAQSVAFDSSSLPERIAVNYSNRSHFSDVESHTISTCGTQAHFTR